MFLWGLEMINSPIPRKLSRGSFYGESGDDELGNQGVIRGNIVMGKGSDTVTFHGGGADNDGRSRGIRRSR